VLAHSVSQNVQVVANEWGQCLCLHALLRVSTHAQQRKKDGRGSHSISVSTTNSRGNQTAMNEPESDVVLQRLSTSFVGYIRKLKTMLCRNMEVMEGVGGGGGVRGMSAYMRPSDSC
jgi:hypothetical protein